MRELDEILDDILAAVELGDSSALAGLILELTTSASLCTGFTDDFFSRVRSLLKKPEFLDLDESWKLSYFLDDAWRLLSVPQREALRGMLTTAFDKHRNYMGAFVIAEILGRRFNDEQALQDLLNLSRVAQLPARALVPHGLETLIENNIQADIKARAVARLRELTKSDDEQVRKEAGISLAKVERKRA